MKLTPVVKSIFIANIIVFALTFLLNVEDIFMKFGLFSVLSENFEPHQFVSHMFLHGGMLHIMMNMFLFITFGPICEKYLGSVKFLIFYLVAGLVAATTFMAINPHTDGPMVGASGAVFGVFFLYSMMNLNTDLYLFFILRMKAKHIAVAMLAWEIFAGITQPEDHTAHFAHVGGALTGILMGLSIRHQKFEVK